MEAPSTSIDLYVKSKTAIYYTQPQCRGGGKGWVPEGGIGYADAHSSEHTLIDKESRLIEVLKEFSKKRHFVLNIHDLALKAEAQRAFFKGISRTPVLIINGKKTYKMPSTEQELALLFTTRKSSAMPPKNDFSIVPVKVILYSRPKKVISTRPVPYDHCAVRGKQWATSTEETYSPGEELILNKLRDMENQGHIELRLKDLNDVPTSLIARLKGVRTPSVRVIYNDNRSDAIVGVENLNLMDLESLMTRKRSAIPPAKIRESTRYLKWIPAKFAAQLGLGFLILLAVFRFIESRAASYTGIHDTMAFYVFILALLPCISGLITMLATFIEMRFTETRLIRYMKRHGIFGAY